MQFINPYRYIQTITPLGSNPITYIGLSVAAVGSQGTASTQSLEWPAGTQPGDLGVIMMSSYNGLYNPTLAGWTNIAGSTEIRYMIVSDPTAPVILPSHTSRYLVHLMSFRGAGNTPTFTVPETSFTASGGVYSVSNSNTTVYPQAHYYYITALDHRATSDSFTVVAPYPFSDINVGHRTPANSAYAYRAISGQQFNGDAILPSWVYRYTPTTETYMSRKHLLIKASALTPPPIGEFWSDQGGWYMGVVFTGSRRYHVIYADKSAEFTAQWKTAAVATTGFPGGALTGKELTDYLIASTTGGAHTAAVNCRMYQGGGFTDWSLPAMSEMAAARIGGLNPSTTTNPIWAYGGAQAPANVYYWTASQASSTSNAYVGYYHSDVYPQFSKTQTHRVRPTRTIAID